MIIRRLFPILLTYMVVGALSLTEHCNYNYEKRIYFCTGITKQFPNDVYSAPHLKCTDCKIKTFTIETFPWTSQLISFNVSDSHIESIYGKAFLNLGPLQYLYLQNNKISSIFAEAFSGLRQMYELHLEYNELSSLRHGILKGFEGFSVLLSHNKLREIPSNVFEGNHGIASLNLSSNKIGMLHRESFRHLDGLEILDLSYNKICYIPLGMLSYFPTLRELSLRANELRSFSIGIFSGLQELDNLDLSYNRLTEFDVSVLLPLKRISQLDLSGNLLNYINTQEMHMNAPTIRNILITDNFWECTVLNNIVQHLKSVNVDVAAKYGGRFHVTNVNGVACSVDPVGKIDDFDRFLYIVEAYTNKTTIYC